MGAFGGAGERGQLEEAAAAAAGVEDACFDVERALGGDRNAQDHLPITLLGLSAADDSRQKVDPVLTETADPGADATTRRPIEDQEYTEGGAELLQPGRLFLWQLPGCIPVPRLGEDANKEDVMASLLTTVAGTGTGTGTDAEKTVDLEVFQAAAAQKLVQDSDGGSRWPLAAEGAYGKLRVHASGRVSLHIPGGPASSPTTYQAVPSSVRAELTGVQRAVAIDADYGQSFDLGRIEGQVVFMPDISQLIEAFDAANWSGAE